MSAEDRLRDAFNRAIATEDPARLYRGIYEYTVVVATPGASSAGLTTPAIASLRPSDGRMPDLVGVKIPMPVSFAGTGALAMTLAPGSKVYIAFADGDPGKPFAIGHEVSN